MTKDELERIGLNYYAGIVTREDAKRTIDALKRAWAERDELKAELHAYRDAGITEELLRNGDGYVKVGCGCLIISATYLDELNAEIAALETRYDSMQRCLLKERDALKAKFDEVHSPINIIFDGPPSHEAGRFVEVEADDGRSVNVGEWKERPGGRWALRIIR